MSDRLNDSSVLCLRHSLFAVVFLHACTHKHRRAKEFKSARLSTQFVSLFLSNPACFEITCCFMSECVCRHSEPKALRKPSEIPDTAAAVSQQRQTNKEDELREYRRKEMKTKIETWKCFVPAINKFGHVYILSYPCHVKVITSLRTLWHKISSMLAKRFLGSLLPIKHHKEKTNENSD